MEDFANSITLYAKDYSPSDISLNELIDLSSNKKRVYPGKNKAAKELSPSKDGYEIKLWLENQYIRKDGTMTESDFNVIYLKDNNEAINFLKVQPPSSPLNNEALIVFSDNSGNSISDVSDNNTIIELKIKDPSFSTLTQAPEGEDYNSLIKFIEIKFEYSNSSISDIWTPCKKIYNSTTQVTTFSNLNSQEIGLDASGVWVLGSTSLFSARVRDDGFHYYYIKLNKEFLGIENGNFQSFHKFRVSYKNGSQSDPDKFGATTESPSIQITEPPKPILSAVKMTAFDELTITLKDMSANLVDSSDNPLDAGNRAVFLRDISFNITRQYGDTKIPVIDISGLKGWSNTNTTTTPIFVSSRKEEKTSYIFTLPPGYLDTSETADLSYNFSLQIKNNINKKWSELSDELSIRITEPDMSGRKINFTLSDISNNVLDISWNYPENGKRGIISSQTNDGLPKIQKFNLESIKFEIINKGDISGNNSHNIRQTERGVDASNISLSFYSKVKAQGETGAVVNFDLSVNAYNEYINNFSSIFDTINISASAPGIVQDLSALFHIIDGSENLFNQNFVDISWDHPIKRGLIIGTLDASNTIIQYDISATKISGNKYTPTNPQISYPTTLPLIDVSNNDTTPHKTSMTDATSKKKISNSSNSKFILPSSSYKIAIRATNSFGISGNWHDFPNEIKTDAPPPPK